MRHTFFDDHAVNFKWKKNDQSRHQSNFYWLIQAFKHYPIIIS